MDSIGTRIKAIRKANKLTQLQLSEKLKVSRLHITRIECGYSQPSAPVILLISLLFNINEDWLKNG